MQAARRNTWMGVGGLKRLAGGLLAAGLLLLLAIQLVPYGRNPTNPPVLQEPPWPSPEVRQLAVRACYDCHSNETRWPAYSRIAPVSWIVYNHVQEGRRKLNFSEWNRPQGECEGGETIREGSMPPLYYVLTHPQARLSAAEKAKLAAALDALCGTVPGGRGDD